MHTHSVETDERMGGVITIKRHHSSLSSSIIVPWLGEGIGRFFRSACFVLSSARRCSSSTRQYDLPLYRRYSPSSFPFVRFQGGVNTRCHYLIPLICHAQVLFYLLNCSIMRVTFVFVYPDVFFVTVSNI